MKRLWSGAGAGGVGITPGLWGQGCSAGVRDRLVKRELPTAGNVGVGGNGCATLQLALIVISDAKCCFFTQEHSELLEHLLVEKKESNGI